MKKTTQTIDQYNINKFEAWLVSEEHAQGTIAKYLRDLKAFSRWLNGKPISNEMVIDWREHLLLNGYKAVTVNSMLASINTFSRFAGLCIKVKFLRIQRKLFQEECKNLKKEEYERLIFTSEKTGNERLARIIETMGATGIRVSEVKYITVEAAKAGKVDISLKRKVRTILLPSKLCQKLIKYAKKTKIASGEIFITKSGKSMSRKQIWSEMKRICEKSGVEASKVFPHNLRHLFARVYYRATRDVAKLADILGHSSIETTRIYLLSTGEEHARQLEGLGLVR